MEFNFILTALVAGIGIAIVSGPLGCFIVWRRMAYFGDALAHSTLFGISLALLFHVNAYLGLIVSCILVIVLLGIISRQKKVSSDAILGILSHSMLAIGLIAASTIKSVKLDLLGFLYGNILTVGLEDLYWIFGINAVVLSLLYFNWRVLVSCSVNEELAKVEGIKVARSRWLLFLLMALVFAISVKLVGVLLITAMLVIPAASARFIAKSPEQMAIISVILGCIAVLLGFQASLMWDWPTGPAIVVTSAAIFSLAFVSRIFRK